jgi:hypothetical protein
LTGKEGIVMCGYIWRNGSVKLGVPVSQLARCGLDHPSFSRARKKLGRYGNPKGKKGHLFPAVRKNEEQVT